MKNGREHARRGRCRKHGASTALSGVGGEVRGEEVAGGRRRQKKIPDHQDAVGREPASGPWWSYRSTLLKARVHFHGAQAILITNIVSSLSMPRECGENIRNRRSGLPFLR